MILPMLVVNLGIMAETVTFPHVSELDISTADKTVSYQVEEAVSFAQKAQGLMYRKHMDEKKGMVFYSNPAKPAAMWMKNTYISLDMLFADDKGEIVCITENTEPLSLEIINCPQDVALTLELNAGEVKKYGIKKGDIIKHHLLRNKLQNTEDYPPKTDENK